VLAGEDIASIGSPVDRLKATVGDRPHSCSAMAMSALEQAMWDVRAHQIGVPVQAVLGGKRRSSIPLNVNINPGLLDHSPDAFTDRAREAASAVAC